MICVEGLSTARQSKDDNDEKEIRKKSTEIPLTADADTPKVVVKAFCTDVLRARIHISTNGMKSGVRILLSHFGGNILEVSLAVLHSSSIKYTAKKLWIIHSVVGCVNEYIERYGRDTAAERYVTPYCRCESHSRRATDEIESECSTQWKRWLAAAHTTHQRPTHGAAIFKCYELHSNYASVFFYPCRRRRRRRRCCHRLQMGTILSVVGWFLLPPLAPVQISIWIFIANGRGWEHARHSSFFFFFVFAS